MAKEGSKVEGKDVKQWFGFNRQDYTVNEIDTDFVAFNKDLAKDLLRRAERLLITGKGLKLVLLHNRGDGKTHMANYIANTLEKRGLVEKVYLPNPAMSRGSRYVELHKAIIKALQDRDIIPNILKKALANPKKGMNVLSNSRNLLNACQSFKNNKGTEIELIRYISGDKLAASVLGKLNVTSALDSADAVTILRIIADLFWNFEEKMLMLIIDEVDNLKDVTLGARDFKEAFRQISEISKLSIIFIFNIATDQKLSAEVLPSPLKDTGVVTRIGSKNYMVAPEAMRIAELRSFVVEVNQKLRGEGFQNAFARATKDYGSEEVDPELFPFTNKGLKAFERKIQRFLSEGEKGRTLLPRSVLLYVNDCCAEATLLGKTAVDENVVEAVGAFS